MAASAKKVAELLGVDDDLVAVEATEDEFAAAKLPSGNVPDGDMTRRINVRNSPPGAPGTWRTEVRFECVAAASDPVARQGATGSQTSSATSMTRSGLSWEGSSELRTSPTHTHTTSLSRQ